MDKDYDALDRVEYVRQSASAGPTRVTRNVYDGAGQLTKVYRAWGSTDQITYAEYGRSWWLPDDLDTLAGEHAAEGVGVLRIPIENQIARIAKKAVLQVCEIACA